jgi:hypothetical protein
MNRLTITKELIKIANLLDNSKLHGEANSLTKIAEDMMDDKFDPMVYNSDDEASDDLDAKTDEFDTLIDSLMKAHSEGDLNDEDISSIMNILNQESGRSTMQMSYDDLEDMEDMEDMEDDFDMGPEEDEFDYESPEEHEDMEDDDFPVQYDEMMAELSKRRKSGPYSGLD